MPYTLSSNTTAHMLFTFGNLFFNSIILEITQPQGLTTQHTCVFDGVVGAGWTITVYLHGSHLSQGKSHISKCTMFRKHKKMFQNKLATEYFYFYFCHFGRLCIRILIQAMDTL